MCPLFTKTCHHLKARHDSYIFVFCHATPWSRRFLSKTTCSVAEFSPNAEPHAVFSSAPTLFMISDLIVSLLLPSLLLQIFFFLKWFLSNSLRPVVWLGFPHATTVMRRFGQPLSLNLIAIHILRAVLWLSMSTFASKNNEIIRLPLPPVRLGKIPFYFSISLSIIFFPQSNQE